MLKLGFHSSIRCGFQVPLVQGGNWAAAGAPKLLSVSLQQGQMHHAGEWGGGW